MEVSEEEHERGACVEQREGSLRNREEQKQGNVRCSDRVQQKPSRDWNYCAPARKKRKKKKKKRKKSRGAMKPPHLQNGGHNSLYTVESGSRKKAADSDAGALFVLESKGMRKNK